MVMKKQFGPVGTVSPAGEPFVRIKTDYDHENSYLDVSVGREESHTIHSDVTLSDPETIRELAEELLQHADSIEKSGDEGRP